MNAGISDSPDSGNSEILFFTAKIDARGRIIVPAAIRRKLGIGADSVVFAGVEKVRRSLSPIISKKDGGEEK